TVTSARLRGGRWSLAAVEPPLGEAELHEGAVGVPPPRAHGRVGEVDVALAFAIARRRAGRARRPLVAAREEIAARLRLREQRRVLVEHGVLVRDDPEVLALRLLEHRGRIRPE